MIESNKKAMRSVADSMKNEWHLPFENSAGRVSLGAGVLTECFFGE